MLPLARSATFHAMRAHSHSHRAALLRLRRIGHSARAARGRTTRYTRRNTSYTSRELVTFMGRWLRRSILRPVVENSTTTRRWPDNGPIKSQCSVAHGRSCPQVNAAVSNGRCVEGILQLRKLSRKQASGRTQKEPGNSSRALFLLRSDDLHRRLKDSSGADDHTGRVGAGLGRLRVNRARAPGLRRASNDRSGDGHVLRRREALKGRSHRRGSCEVGTVLVSSVLLFVGRKVAKVGLHRGDIRLVFRICELRNRDRGKNADDDDYDQKLNEGKTLFVAHLRSPESVA